MLHRFGGCVVAKTPKLVASIQEEEEWCKNVEGVKCPRCPPTQWLLKPMECPLTSLPFAGVGKLKTGVHTLGSLSLCVDVERVILGHASPGSAGFAHWIKSSSGGRRDSRPFWPIHCKMDNIKQSVREKTLKHTLRKTAKCLSVDECISYDTHSAMGERL